MQAACTIMSAQCSHTRFVTSGRLVPAAIPSSSSGRTDIIVPTKLLEELATKLMCFGNHTLDAIASEFWPEFSAAVRTVVFAHREKTLAKRSVAALFASRIYLQVGRLAECLQYALAAGDMFNGGECDAYVAAILSQFVDRYAERDPSSSSSWDLRMEAVIGCLLDKCLDDRDHQSLLWLGLRARRMDMVTRCVNLPSDDRNEMLPYAILATMNYVDNSGFRNMVLFSLVNLLESQMAAPDHVNLMRCYVFLDNAKSACQLLQSLIRNDNRNSLYLVAFDLYELASQQFLTCVLDSLKQTVLVSMTTHVGLPISKTECDVDELHYITETVAVVPSNVNKAQPDNKLNSTEFEDKYSQETIQNLIKVLSGEICVEENLKFLAKNNHADMSILNNTRKVIWTSICHTATMIANGFMHSGTANDIFLREYLEFANWTTWDLFSAFVSLGVIYRGHVTDSFQMINSYLHLMRNNVSGSSGYSKGGGLYALGLIYANHGAAINDYLLRQLKDERREIVKHGGCLGIGLSAMGTGHKDIYEQLKIMMYQDNDVFGEAIGLAMGLVMLGSKNSEALQDMVIYAQSTQQEHILRGLAIGISFFMYSRLEEADLLITCLLQEKNPILRCSAMYTISMAYCGTGSKTAVKKLLHAANSDVNDDVRCAAVTSLGFLLFRTPEQCLQIISVFAKSYNPYVRYGAAMALGIAYAGTGHREALCLLEPMTTDFVNYVRQGAFIASALICIQQTESTCSKLKYFHTLYAKVITEKYGDDVVKFGAILAQGIIDGGGGNVYISMDSRTGYLNTLTVVGLLLFTQYQHCICLAHCLTLAFTPICTIGFNTKLKIPTCELQSSNQIRHEVCFSSLCQELAEKRGWIKYLFKHFKLKSKKQRLTKFENFAYRFLLPKILRDVEIIKSNWQTGHFSLQRINCSSKYIKGVKCVQYDSDKIVSGLCDNTIKIWNKYTLECIKVFIGHTGSVMCLQYDDKIIISGSSDTTVLVWNIATGEIVNKLTFHNEAVLHLRFIGNILATCSKDCSIGIWNILTPSEITLYRVLNGHLAEVNVVNFDNKYIVSGSKDCTIKVWNTLTCDFVRALTGHYLGITCLHYKDRLVVSGSFDHTIRLWDIEYGTCLRVIEDCAELAICIKFNSKIIVNGAYNGNIKVWDLEAALDPSVPECSLCLRTLKVHTDIVYELQFDEFQIISCSKDDTILVWDFLNFETESNNRLIK